MKFLTDENVASSVVTALRKVGYNIKDIKESKLYGLFDKEIMKRAYEEDRIIITHDKDFGNLFSDSKIKHKGVILLRLKNQHPDNVLTVLLKVLKSAVKDKFVKNLTVISESKITIHQKY